MSVMDAAGSLLGRMEGGWGGVAAGIGIVIALLHCFLGYRLLKVWISVIGFLIGFLVSFGTAMHFLDDKTGICVLIGIALGVAVAFLAYKVYLLGVFLLCGGMTMAAVYLFMTGNWPGLESWIPLLVSGLSGVLAGVLSVMFTKPLIILTTGINGGLSAGTMIFEVLGIVNPVAQWILCAVIAAAGTVVQFVTSGKSTGRQRRR